MTRATRRAMRVTRHIREGVVLLLSGQAALFSSSALAAPTEGAHPAPVGIVSGAAGNTDGVKAARVLERTGEAKFSADDYQGALSDFMAAEDAAPSLGHQWFIGHCEDHLGRYHAALEAYAKFLSADPAVLGPRLASNLPETRERSAAIKAMPVILRVEATPASASLRVDDAEQAGSPPFEVKVAPGPHSLRVSSTGYEAETVELDVAYASPRTVTVALREAPATVTPAPAAPVVVPPRPVVTEEASSTPPHPALTRRNLGWLASGLAVVGAGFGTAFGIVAVTTNSSYTDHPTLGRAYRASDFAVYSDVTFGAAVALGASGLVLLLTGDSPDAHDIPASSSPSATKPASAKLSDRWTLQPTPLALPHGAGAGAVLRF